MREVRDPAGTPYRFAYTNQKVAVGYHTLKTTTYPGSEPTVIGYHYARETGEPTDISFAALTGKSYNNVRYSWFMYDAGQRATSTEHAGGVEKNTFAYAVPAADELSVTHTSPLGKKAVYDFKNGRLMTVKGQASTYCPATGRSNAYDANGYPDVVTDDKGNVTNFDYNAKGQLLSRVEAQGTPVARTTLYTWDSARNRITQVTVVGHSRTAHTFTADNRLASVTVTNLTANGVASQARTTNYTYTKHANGLLATMAVDGPLPSDTVTSTYSAMGDLLSVRNGLGHTTSYGNHNALGQPGRVTGPNGAVTEFIYDQRGRITAASAIVNGVPQTTRYTFDGAGRPTTVSTPDNVTSTREYDAAGRVLREYQTEAGGTFAVKEYTYNNASQPVSITVQRTTAVAPVSTSPPTGVPTLTTPATDNDGAFTISWTSVSTATSYEVRQRKDGGAWSTVYNSSGLSQGVS
ncbi:MAG: RHS repeat protein, partial [Lysobacter sp.]|nr:RHS repeat protein [Lysobacter sp.]